MEKTDYLFGIRAVTEALKAGKEIDRVLVKTGAKGELFDELFALFKEQQIPYQYVPIEKINRITTKNHQGVLAMLQLVPYFSIEQLIPGIFEQGRMPFLLVLDGITDVRNFGAIARSAECAGIDAIIIPAKGAAQISSDAIKTSAGALHHIPVCRTQNLKKTLQYLIDSGIQLVGATEKASAYYTEFDYKQPVAIIVGAEDTGLSDDAMRMSSSILRIPIKGKIDSLNVSVAAGVILYEGVRQRLQV